MPHKQTAKQKATIEERGAEYVPEVEVEVDPRSVPLGSVVDVSVNVTNFNRDYQYTIEDWDPDAGEILSGAPDHFSGRRPATAQWNTNTADMTIGDHGVSATVTAHRGSQVLGRKTDTAVLRVTEHRPQVTLMLEKDCEDEIFTIRQGESLCVTAHATNIHPGFEYECYIETPTERIKGTPLEAGRWRAHIPTDDLVGHSTLTAKVHARPRPADRTTTVKTKVAKEAQ